MIPILFAGTETSFTSNGLGRLSDATKCEVTEERNGVYELVLEYPITGSLFRQLIIGNYILATHDNNGDAQPFQIYRIDQSSEGFCEVRAWHISYLLNNIILEPFTASSCAAAIAAIPTHSINNNPFTFWTDKVVTKDFELSIPASVRSVLGGSSGSLLDTYGKGEYEFDKFTVKLYLNRGSDRGVTIRYGKNLVTLDRELDGSNIFNAVVPYWTDGTNTVNLDHTVVKSGETEGKAIALDLSEAFDTQPTTAQLEARAQSYINGTSSYELKENLKIDFVQLWQTEEYKNVANLQRISLCDTVTIIYTKLNVNVSAKCIKVVYDTLKERYSEMELGTPRTNLTQQIQDDIVSPAMSMVPSKSMMKSAIDRATELISGGYGGYAVWHYLSDGTPSELLFLDAPDESQAVNIIRFNRNGVGFSTDGGVTYQNAWTIDGHLNADFITVGTLVGITITGNTIQGNDIIGGTITGSLIKTTGTYDSGIVGTTEIYNGSVKSTGTDNGSPAEQFESVFEASGVGLDWYSENDPTEVWKTFLAAGELYLQIVRNGNITKQIALGPDGIQNINNMAAKHIFLDQSVSSDSSLDIEVGSYGTYWSGIVVGMAQGVGPVIIGLTYNNGTLTRRNLMTNSSWNNNALRFACSVSGGVATLTVTSNNSNTSKISLFIG